MEKDEYPPIPITIEGLLSIKKITDLNMENKIINTENKNLKLFFFIRGDEGIFVKSYGALLPSPFVVLSN